MGQEKALAYLKHMMTSEDDLYTLAMSAYAFQLAGDPQADTILATLESKATMSGE